MSEQMPPGEARLPSSYPTLLVSLVLGLVGLVPMRAQTRNAARLGVETDRYWRAFVLGAVLNLVLLAAAVLALVLTLRHYLG